MVILSLFDGISCARVAAERAGITIDKYYASEIDKYAIQVAQKNYPDTIQLGSVTDITIDTITEPIDLICGGSPCQDLSIAGQRAGLTGQRSGLFWHFVRLVKELSPTHFVLENVASMSKESRNTISEALNVNPILIDSSRVSAQRRQRYFWADFPISQPKLNPMTMKDILGPRELAKDITDKMLAKRPGTLAHVNAWKFVRTPLELCRTLTTGGQGISNTGATNLKVGDRYYKLTEEECEKLMGLPPGYTTGISSTQRYACIGNGFHVDIVAHILHCMVSGEGQQQNVLFN